MLQFQRRYFAWAVFLFLTEVLIAAFLHDKVIRPYVGDVLVVMLMYCFVKSFLDVPVVPLAISVLLFAFMIEILQYFDLANHLGLGESSIARIVLGSSFEWLDLMAYTTGVIAILYIEKRRRLNHKAAANDH